MDIGQIENSETLEIFIFSTCYLLVLIPVIFFVASKSWVTIKGRKGLTYKKEHQVDQGYDKFI